MLNERFGREYQSSMIHREHSVLGLAHIISSLCIYSSYFWFFFVYTFQWWAFTIAIISTMIQFLVFLLEIWASQRRTAWLNPWQKQRLWKNLLSFNAKLERYQDWLNLVLPQCLKINNLVPGKNQHNIAISFCMILTLETSLTPNAKDRKLAWFHKLTNSLRPALKAIELKYAKAVNQDSIWPINAQRVHRLRLISFMILWSLSSFK